jgi:large repetitive protein
MFCVLATACGDNHQRDEVVLVVTPEDGLETTEAGGTATFTVALSHPPTAPIEIAVASSRTAEGTVSPATMTLTRDNYDLPVTVTITGVNDDVADGDQAYTVRVDAGALGAVEVAVTNRDDDTAGIGVSPQTGLVTTEGGAQATFTVVLHTRPAADVVVPLATGDPSEGSVTPQQLTFTPASWNAPQLVTVTGVDDAIADGPQTYLVEVGTATSDDPVYDGMDPDDVEVTNLDDDSAGILVTPTTGLQTTESGGSATFTVRLLSQPTASVTIALTSSDPSEGTASPASLVFTPVNFNAPQVVTVTGVDDAVADGNQLYTIITAPATSVDPGYDGLDSANVSVTNIDNDSAGILVSPTSGLVTTEGGGTATFHVVLTSQPTANVVIPVVSDRPDEGVTSVSSLTFTSQNFNAPQAVTVTGVDDAVADGNQPYTIVLGAAASADLGYAGLDPDDVSVINLDNDSAGIVVAPTQLVVSEAGTSDVFTVVLLSQPTANVTIAVSSSDPTEGSVFPASLTFTPANFAVPQTVTVTGVDDAIADGNQQFAIVLAPAVSADPGYHGIDPADVAVTNLDDDSPGFVIDPLELEVSEFGDSDSFTIALTSQPTADVTITFSSSNPNEGTVSPTSVTFTPQNFHLPQTVTVTGVDDAIVDGNQVFTIITGAAVSADPGYDGLDPPDVTVTNIDNETAHVFVQKKKLFTTESGGSSFFKMKLTTQPTADVTCTVTSSDLTEGQVTPQILVFTPANFSQFQTITVIGLDDEIQDGNQLYVIITHPCTSADPAYDGFDPRDIQVINRDND